MKVRELLLEMPIKIDTIRTKYGNLSIQIRTRDSTGGQQEHPPAHLHVVYKLNGSLVDTPVLLDPEEPSYPEDVEKLPSKYEYVVFNYIKYNYTQLKQTFDKAQVNADPSTTYSGLQNKNIQP